MEQFIGNKIINAVLMTRLAYNQFRGWELPLDENGDDEGYLVEYVDGGEANTNAYDGYVSWSPKSVFDRAYNPVTEMTFGDALVMLKAGRKVARAGWNGKGMHIYLEEGRHLPLAAGIEKGTTRIYDPVFVMYTAQGSHQPGWLASQSDMLSEDWCIVE